MYSAYLIFLWISANEEKHPYRELDKLSEEVQDYEKFLTELRNAADSQTAGWLQTLLLKVCVICMAFPCTATNYQWLSTAWLPGEDGASSNQTFLPPPPNDAEAEEPSPMSSIGSLDGIDQINEDPNRTDRSRATGVMGKTSEITWMQRVQREAEQRAQGQAGSHEANNSDPEEPKDGFSLHSMNYHLDDLDISVPGPVQKYEMPSRYLADRLFDDYFTTTHPFFPILSRSLFRNQYRTYYDNSRPDRPRPGDKWLAIVNVIFAIAAKHAHLVNASWRGEDNDHLVYLTRARMLSMNSDVLFNHPDLQQVQVEGLTAFYLLAADQINRPPSITKEARYRVWWCLYSFEHMLGAMTGRSIYSLEGGYATPLPLPFEEEQLQENPAAAEVLNNSTLRDALINNVMASSWIRPTGSKNEHHDPRLRDQSWLKNLPINFGLCYLYYSDLTVVTQEIINKVYTTTCTLLPWTDIESRLDEMRIRIDMWKSSLPRALDFTEENTNDSPDQLRCKLFLAFHYYSAKITLGRPCLCRRDNRRPKSPQTFSHNMALTTIDAASRMLELIPDEPDVIQLYQVCPWWSVLRYLMQAATVFLLELSFGCVHVPEQEKTIVSLTKKCIRWFFAMSERSIGSRRAWQLCDTSFRNLASGMKYNTDDLPTQNHQDYVPARISPLAPIESGNTFALPSGDYFTMPMEDLNLFGHQNPLDGELLPNYFNPNPNPNPNPHPQNSDVAQGHVEMNDEFYLPYDPLSGDFIRSFFPSSEEDKEQQ
ncbi:hypothetical protein N7470_008283 [Penicillium chermesinum]|nr:hypothetical protein N7470_008283 [Penicillium chermesinum]